MVLSSTGDKMNIWGIKNKIKFYKNKLNEKGLSQREEYIYKKRLSCYRHILEKKRKKKVKIK